MLNWSCTLVKQSVLKTFQPCLLSIYMLLLMIYSFRTCHNVNASSINPLVLSKNYKRLIHRQTNDSAPIVAALYSFLFFIKALSRVNLKILLT